MTRSFSDCTWPSGARLALSIVLNVEEGAEMRVRDGDDRPEPVDELSAAPRDKVRAHGNESNYLYGIEAGAPRVLRLLEERDIPVTVTAAALALERAPQLADVLVSAGHEVACHGYRWVHQFRMDEPQEREFIQSARDSIARHVGTRPVGWLSRYLHTPNTRRLLVEEGFLYHMDDYSGDTPFFDEVDMGDGTRKRMLILPYAVDTNDMKMWVAPSYTPKDWAQYVIDSIEWLAEEASSFGPRMLSVGLHLRIIGRPGRMGALKKVLDYVAARHDLWVATRRDIAKAYTEIHEALE